MEDTADLLARRTTNEVLESWLSSIGDTVQRIRFDTTDELQAMLDPYPYDQMDAYEITTAVNSPENDSPEVVKPVGHGQSGLGDFA